MSITFRPTCEPLTYKLDCESAEGVYFSYAAAAEAASEHTCDDALCEGYGPPIVPVDFPQVNVSNANVVLDALGFPVPAGELPPAGQCDAEDFLGRVLTAIAFAPVDAGVPARQLVPGETAPLFGPVTEHGPTSIDCGRSAGYLQNRLAALRDVAEYARQQGSEVSWK